ncbi:hypothetical protein EYF80_064121 [Liparis tanakae]|uniref:Uncharacterized protein n=1 Tax=Liparis tanakae TaxID=230148 RepID=A0A4Z2EA45_9TELE|nr:hypothetical protein EYF80_064121 [Liparis tanakae]
MRAFCHIARVRSSGVWAPSKSNGTPRRRKSNVSRRSALADLVRDPHVSLRSDAISSDAISSDAISSDTISSDAISSSIEASASSTIFEGVFIIVHYISLMLSSKATSYFTLLNTLLCFPLVVFSILVFSNFVLVFSILVLVFSILVFGIVFCFFVFFKIYFVSFLFLLML